MQKTKYYSWNSGKLPKGCQLCVKGEKLVLFITGLCPRNCFYCPISDQKYKKDVIYADEWPIKKEKEVIEEAKLIGAKGAGITGGDPFSVINRTVKYIKLLKKTFGKKFHIHIYTSLDLINDKKLNKLYKAGLDEIRIHPEIYNDKLWNKIKLIKKYNWDVGVEIPSIPNAKRQTEELINYFKDYIDFLNINELEFSDNKTQKLGTFVPKDRFSYGVKGSEEFAKHLLKNYEKEIKNIHYCTAKLKDRVQLGNRLKRRAKNIATKFDRITKEGTLIRNVIYTKNPKKTKKLLKDLIQGKDLIEDKDRLIISRQILNKYKESLKKLKLKLAIIEEYPTYDRMPVEVEFI